MSDVSSEQSVPTSSTDRIMALDIMRGFALFGILLLNITGFGLVWAAYANPAVMGGHEGINQTVWLINSLLTEGTMRTIFSMMFGAGVILLTSRMEATGRQDICADIYYRRTLWLVIFGVIHSYLLLWTGEVLYMYGIVGLMLFPLRKLTPRILIISGFIALLAYTPTRVSNYQESMNAHIAYQEISTLVESEATLNNEQQEVLDKWTEIDESTNPTVEQKEKDLSSVRGGYWTMFDWAKNENIAYYGTNFYAGGFLDVLSMMLIGMGLLKLGVLTAARTTSFYIKMMIVGYSVGVSVNWYEAQMILADNFSTMSFVKAGITYDLGRLFVAAGHIGLVMTIIKLGLFNWLQNGLAAVGKMALTSYISHSIICGIIFYGVGFGLYGTMERHELYYVVFAIYVFQLIFSPLWLRYYKFGPIEWVWRSLTYLKKQPMRK